MAFNNIYSGKKILITGNTGFKGSWLTTWFLNLGAEVYGYSNGIPTTPSMFEELNLAHKIVHKDGDIRDEKDLSEFIQCVKPDFIFHLAAQAIVSVSYNNPLDTVSTNTLGTACIMEAIRHIEWACTCIIITSDKAYDNVEWIWGYRENDSLGGKDVYSGSKGAAELIIKSYWHSFIKKMPNIKLGIARAGNVIGGGDWAKDRIIVDSVKAFARGEMVELRSPDATRPWQHVLEPLSGYLTLGWLLSENKVENGEAYNFGPKDGLNRTVLELVKDLAEFWGLSSENAVKVVGSIPFKEATLLRLNCDKAIAYLNWHATLHYNECVKFIADWYKLYYSTGQANMYSLTISQIESYMNNAKKQNLKWAL